MGKVYLCEDESGGGESGHLVAVKVLHPELRSRDFLRRFEEERRIQSQLHHPNVCRFLGSGIAEHGSPFIVMEYIRGSNIDAFCKRMRYDPVQCFMLFTQALAAVEYFSSGKLFIAI